MRRDCNICTVTTIVMHLWRKQQFGKRYDSSYTTHYGSNPACLETSSVFISTDSTPQPLKCQKLHYIPRQLRPYKYLRHLPRSWTVPAVFQHNLAWSPWPRRWSWTGLQALWRHQPPQVASTGRTCPAPFQRFVSSWQLQHSAAPRSFARSLCMSLAKVLDEQKASRPCYWLNYLFVYLWVLRY